MFTWPMFTWKGKNNIWMGAEKKDNGPEKRLHIINNSGLWDRQAALKTVLWQFFLDAITGHDFGLLSY